jgi:hypothetical protein
LFFNSFASNCATLKIKSLVVLLCIVFARAHAQEISFKDSVTAYNLHRIQTNKRGMKVLGAWGILNIAAGGAGYFAAKNEELKYFSEMNVLWGVVNTGIAVMGMAGVKKEMAAKLNYQQSYDRYRANKKLYLINAGLDVVYIGTGVALNEYGKTATNDKAIYQGFGKSITVQGVFLLLFDNVMFASHLRYNSKWYLLMNELRFTGNGVGFVHSF